MPTVPISMRKLKEILRLKYGAGLSHRQIGRSLAISPSVISRYANRAAQLGIKQWPLPPEWDDAALHRAFLQTQVKMKKHSLPDWATVHKELRNKCVTLQLLWEEYGERNPGGSYSYNHYYRMYREWLKTTSPSMRQIHKAGEKLFIDYCGPTVDITNPDTGEIRTAQIFVAVLGASSYTWAEATWSQQLEDWVMSHVRCFQWLGGVPELVVPDNLKSATSRACKYDPDINPTYQQMLEHYNVAVIPARPRKPKDKAKAIVQGLREYPYAGVFSDEAILFFTGHLKNNLGLINKIWKNEPVSLTRKKEGSIKLNAYLTFLLMVQPEIFDEYLEKNGKRAVSSGFLARFLFTNTVSTIGQRNVNLNQEKSDRALNVLFEQFNEFFNAQKQRFYDNSIHKKILTLTDNAKNLFKAKVNQFQFNIGKNQPWEHIPEFVSKANNQAIRIAALFSYPSKDGISESTLNDAFTITAWHLNQAGAYFYTLSEQYQLQQDVYMLFDWIKNRFLNPIGHMKVANSQTGLLQDIKLQPGQPFSKNELEMYGPAKLRKVDQLTPVLNQLIQLGLIVTICYPPHRAVYIAIAGVDMYGNIMAQNHFFASYTLVDCKNNTPPPLDGYDPTKLQWQ